MLFLCLYAHCVAAGVCHDTLAALGQLRQLTELEVSQSVDEYDWERERHRTTDLAGLSGLSGLSLLRIEWLEGLEQDDIDALASLTNLRCVAACGYHSEIWCAKGFTPTLANIERFQPKGSTGC
jgi:hypothetical protein